MEVKTDFAAQLRWWRSRRGLAQLELAGIAEISQRHLSFLELGRTAPSREMVLRLAAALDVPLRQQNALLAAAGFAPIWAESPLGAGELAMVERALELMLAQHEPFPAFVVDRRWQLLRFNAGASRFVEFLSGTPLSEPDRVQPLNLADALLAPDVLRPLIANWHDVALHFVRSVHADAMADGTIETARLLERLLAYPDVPRVSDVPRLEDSHEPVLTIDFVRDGVELRLFTTLATLGTPRSVTTQEVRIECFFPANDETAARLRGLTR
jgi:transcriptional regulator with XRE-family HTH domain